jgi:hypothetical protein
MEDGWMLGPDRQLLFWIPPDYRTSLYRPSTRFVIGRNAIHLDLSNFAQGTNWVECFQERHLDSRGNIDVKHNTSLLHMPTGSWMYKE